MTPTLAEQIRRTALADLYPDLTEEQLQEADERLTRYVELALRIYNRIRNDPEAYARFKALTSGQDGHSMPGPRSPSTPTPST